MSARRPMHWAWGVVIVAVLVVWLVLASMAG